MKFLLEVTIPHEAFNAAVKDGSINDKMNRIMTTIRPDAAYFTTMNGKRGAIMIVDIDNAFDLPVVSEPWFLLFNADVQVKMFMTPEELERSGLEELGRKWRS
jgi:hypothetical protein